MAKRLTRQELYDLVWAEPRSRLGKRLGISDVGLSKVCKKANIPMPGPGYWAKLEAGKKLPHPCLSPRGPGQLDYVTFTGNSRTDDTTPPQEDEATAPSPDLESLQELERRVRQAVGMVRLPKTLANPHRLIAHLLEQDEIRREKQKASPYPLSWETPIFDSRHERRRLRFLNATLLALTKQGYRVDADSRDARSISVRIWDQHVSFTLDWAGKNFGKEAHQRSTAEQKPPFKLRLELRNHWTKELPVAWEDTEDQPLEGQMTEIIVRLIVGADKQLRDAIKWNEEWQRQHQVYLEKRRQEEEAARDKANVDALLEAAAQWRKACDIRDFAAAMQKADDPNKITVGGKPLNEWCTWARAQADKIDPTIPQPSAG